MSRVKKLEWDTIFFGFPVGRTILTAKNSFEDLLDIHEELTKFRLIYLFVESRDQVLHDLLHKNGYQSFSKTLTFESKLRIIPALKENDKCREITLVDDNLIELSLQAGHYSRFRLDPTFEQWTFIELYKTWITNSVNGKIADIVLGYYDVDTSGAPIGFVTCKINDRVGEIGLIAVDSKSRGRGIGKALINTLKLILLNRSVEILLVKTQEANRLAVSFYENCNFTRINEIDIYHLWNENTLQ